MNKSYEFKVESDKMPILYKNESKGQMLCLQFNQCKGCELCIEVCPNNVLEKSKEKNKNSQYPPAIKNDVECILCKSCELICPDFSIYVTSIPEAS